MFSSWLQRSLRSALNQRNALSSCLEQQSHSFSSEPYPLKKKGLQVSVPPRSTPNRELSRLFRLLRKEGYQERWRTQHYHISPSEERVLAQKETAQRLAKRKFKQMMSYIMKRRERGF